MINDLRISGFASGLDTETMVKKLMEAERKPLDKLYQAKTWNTWKMDAFREINTKLLDFRTSMEKLRLQSTFDRQTVSTTDANKVGAGIAGKSTQLSYEITGATLAKPALAASVKFTTAIPDTTTEIGEDISFDLNGTTINLKSTYTINDVISEVNKVSSTTGVTASYFSAEKSIVFTTTAKGAGANITISNATAGNVLGISDGQLNGSEPPAIVGSSLTLPLSFSGNDPKINIKIDGVAQEISLPSLVGQTYDNYETLRGVLQNDIDTALAGTNQSITVQLDGDKLKLIAGDAINSLAIEPASGDDVASDLGFVTGDSDISGTFSGDNVQTTVGQDLIPGSATINGMTFSIDSNTFTYDGVKFELKSNVDSANPVIVRANTDTEAIFNDIKTFVDKYNELIKDLNAKISEKRYRDYQPLLEEQKEAMKEKEIELWEEKAKSGLLRNDPIISKFLTRLRTALSTPVDDVDSKFDTLAEIGIKTSSNYRDNGKLELDETKLRGLIESDLGKIKELFTKSYDTGTISDTTVTKQIKYEKSGLAWRVYDQINSSISELTKHAGAPNSPYEDTQSNLAKELDRLDDRIDAFEERLIQIEDRYWRQFTAMEKAISQSNAQSSWLMQQFSGGM